MNVATPAQARLVRLTEIDRAPVGFFLDGEKHGALMGDTILTAVLSVSPFLQRSENGSASAAGFCLMGACQGCWVWQENGPRLRACSTPLTEGMRLLTAAPENWP